MEQRFLLSNDNVGLRTKCKFCVDGPFLMTSVFLDVDIDSAERLPKESSAIKE